MFPSKHLKAFGILFVLTVFSTALLVYRIQYADSRMYSFLIWNLFLAWIPYGISLLIPLVDNKLNNRLLTGVLLFSWLLFLPNAPYIFTDFFHLKHRAPLPLWFDISLIMSFSWTGIMLGYYSLVNVQQVLAKRNSNIITWVFVCSALILCGFGIYLGRFQRWNSWDILNNPMALFLDITDKLLHPFLHMYTLGSVVVFSAFLILAYLSIRLIPKG